MLSRVPLCPLSLLWFIFNLSHHFDATTRSKELTLNTTLWTKLQASFTKHQLSGKCPLPVPKSCPGALDCSERFILPRWLLTDFLSPHPLQPWHFSKDIYSPVTVVECRLIYMCLMCFHDWDEVKQDYHREITSLFWWRLNQGCTRLMYPVTDYVKLKGLGKLRTVGFPTR